ncbi:hypothetical protein ACJMK2_035980 [Sinanodonta woodiana]|uniref:DDE Tnp4 domain-containing protein n=1 Tax=Sinanodonta woodiana TaxID=1069815 RepID=A0ABD3WFR3_SINWO
MDYGTQCAQAKDLENGEYLVLDKGFVSETESDGIHGEVSSTEKSCENRDSMKATYNTEDCALSLTDYSVTIEHTKKGSFPEVSHNELNNIDVINDRGYQKKSTVGSCKNVERLLARRNALCDPFNLLIPQEMRERLEQETERRRSSVLHRVTTFCVVKLSIPTEEYLI